jgi:hypothetical protein
MCSIQLIARVCTQPCTSLGTVDHLMAEMMSDYTNLKPPFKCPKQKAPRRDQYDVRYHPTWSKRHAREETSFVIDSFAVSFNENIRVEFIKSRLVGISIRYMRLFESKNIRFWESISTHHSRIMMWVNVTDFEISNPKPNIPSSREYRHHNIEKERTHSTSSSRDSVIDSDKSDRYIVIGTEKRSVDSCS